MLIARLWPHMFHGYRARGHYMRVPRMAIACVAHDKLLETCMFHTTRKRGPSFSVAATINGVSVTFLLDTGSALSILIK